MKVVFELLNAVEVIVFLWAIMQVKFHKSLIKHCGAMMLLPASAIIRVYSPDIDLGMIVGVIIGQTFGVIFLFDDKIFRLMARFWVATFAMELIYIPGEMIFAVVRNISGASLNKDLEKLLISLIAIGVILLIGLLMKKNRDIVLWIRNLPTVYFVVAGICLTAVSGVGYYISDVAGATNSRARILIMVLEFVLSISVYMLCISFAASDYMRKKYKEETILKDRYLNTAINNYDALSEHVSEIRRIKHDIKAHLKILDAYAADGNIELLREYLGTINEDYREHDRQVVNTGNRIVDAIISEKISICNVEGITIECEGRIGEPGDKADRRISDYDLCIIFSNLLSNAVEACRRLTSSEKKIHIALENTGGEIRIEFGNPIEWEVDVKRLGYYTSKQDKNNHGLGIGNVQRVADKYKGIMTVLAEDGLYKTLIVIAI